MRLLNSELLRITIVALSTLGAGAAFAESADAADGQAMGAPIKRAADPDFVEQAVSANQAEIAMGKLALQKGSSTSVRNVARHLVKDHKRSNDQLKRIVVDEGAGVPPDSLNADQQTAVDRLKDLSGREFDKAYLDAMKRDHEQAITLFQTEADSGTDTRLRSFAKATLPALHQHSEMVNSSRSKM